MHVDRKISARMDKDEDFRKSISELEDAIALLSNDTALVVGNVVQASYQNTSSIQSLIASRAYVMGRDKAEQESCSTVTVVNTRLDRCVASVVSALDDLERARFTQNQPNARRKLDGALATLKTEFNKTQNAIERIAS